ncbi:MAG: hypothetical protein H6737_19210 [Alphaproteobacteria bacterium]|nr:hypothetical protein [Alphaproteobacteria bacterium]
MVPLLAAACSGPFTAPDGTDANNDDQDAVVLQPETVLLDDLAGVQALDVETDQLVLHTDGSALPVEVGSVVVGRMGGGYLREVLDVVDQGDRIVLRTRQADLSQAVVNGKAKAQILIAEELRSATTWDLGGRVLVDETLWSDAEGDYVEVTAFIADGSHVTIDPVFDFDLELFNGSWVDAEFSSTVTLDYEADVIATVSGRFDQEVSATVISRSVPFAFELGPVPVVGTAHIDLVAGVGGTFAGAGSTTLHTEAHAWGSLGAGYDGDWHGSYDGDVTGDLAFQDSSWDQDLHARVFLRAEMGVELYGAAGADLVLEPWVEANSCGTVGIEVDGGLKGSHGYHFEAFGWNLFEWGPYPFDVGTWDLYEQCDV